MSKTVNKFTESLTVFDLLTLDLFKSEDPQALTWLLPYCNIDRVSENHILLDPTVQNKTIYFILEGQAHVQLENQGQYTFSHLNPGQCIGEMSIIEGTAPSAIVLTSKPSTLLSLPGEILWQLIDRSHAVSKNLIHTLSSRVRQDNKVLLESLEQQHIHEQKSKNDALTNLYNRRWLDEMLPRIFERYQTHQSGFTIIMIDIDHFKKYNDNYGHQSGDMVLKKIAATISENIRPNDMAARYGGEEFIVMLPKTNIEKAKIIAQRLRSAIKTATILNDNKTELPTVTASFGIATLRNNINLIELISNADNALYQSKELGRDCVSCDQ